MQSVDPQAAGPAGDGGAWEAAIAFGIDVSLLEENLAKTPEERLAELVAMQALFDLVHPDRAAEG